MPVFRWGNPLHALPDLEREMDRWIKSMEVAFEGLRLGRPFPSLNVFETPQAYLLTADLPGCNVNDLDIHVADGKLTIKGIRAPSTTIPADRFRRSERVSGTWERIVALPERVDEHAIQAELTDGILKVHLPKLPATTPRQIRLNQTESVANLPVGLPHHPLQPTANQQSLNQPPANQHHPNEAQSIEPQGAQQPLQDPQP